MLAKTTRRSAAAWRRESALAAGSCPGIISYRPTYDRYLRYSELTRELYGSYTDRVEPYGLDECWLDVTESARSRRQEAHRGRHPPPHPRRAGV
ncbi:MAG: hypothetical protein ACLUFV_10555 [Acutalibacteraceae bacterium]